MLVLTRKSMQCIEIGEWIVVTVLEIRGNKVRIGIEAPQEIRVRRTELQERLSELSTGSVPATLTTTES